MFDDTENYIKDNLQNIIDGKFDDKLSPEELKMMLEMSFLYNHISIENDSITFKYNGVKLSIFGGYPKKIVTSYIKNDVVFKSALKQFLRDKKINDILNEKNITL